MLEELDIMHLLQESFTDTDVSRGRCRKILAGFSFSPIIAGHVHHHVKKEGRWTQTNSQEFHISTMDMTTMWLVNMAIMWLLEDDHHT
jgi:hypothetical protein